MEAMEVGRFGGDGLDLSVTHRPGRGGDAATGLLFLHGWPGTGADWRPVADRLAADPDWDDAHLLLPDLRGFGRSDVPAVDHAGAEPYRRFSPAAHGADLDALLGVLGVDRVIVAGYDIGANLAQATANRTDGRTAGLVLFDPVHPAARAQAGRLNPAELWYQHFHALDWSHRLVSESRRSVEVYLRHFYTHWWGEGTVPEEHFQTVVDAYSRPGAFEASIGWYRARAAGRAREAAAALRSAPLAAPVEVVWGGLDPITPVIFAESVRDSYADATLTVVPGAGHFGPLECPEQLVAACGRLAARLGWIS